MREPVITDGISRDRRLRDVVEQIVQHDLHRQHRQERQQKAGTGNAEHVADVGAGSHAQILDDVAEDPASLYNAIMQHGQVVLQEHNVR